MTKRFWHRASVAPAEGGWGVLLDGKPLLLTSGAVFATSYPALAQAVGAEWQAAGIAPGGTFAAADVSLTGMAAAAQACVGHRRVTTVAMLATYAQADLLCYRVEMPRGLAARQEAAWQPWLDWAARRHGAVLGTTTAIARLAQPAASVAALREALAALSDPHLAALGIAIPALGSCVLGLALAERAIEPAAAADCAMLDETYQQERWGSDAEAAARRADIRAEIALAAWFMQLTEPNGILAAEAGP